MFSKLIATAVATAIIVVLAPGSALAGGAPIGLDAAHRVTVGGVVQADQRWELTPAAAFSAFDAPRYLRHVESGLCLDLLGPVRVVADAGAACGRSRGAVAAPR